MGQVAPPCCQADFQHGHLDTMAQQPPEPLPSPACAALEAHGLAGPRPPSWVAAESIQSLSSVQ